jgi:hypothetical protein
MMGSPTGRCPCHPSPGSAGIRRFRSRVLGGRADARSPLWRTEAYRSRDRAPKGALARAMGIRQFWLVRDERGVPAPGTCRKAIRTRTCHPALHSPESQPVLPSTCTIVPAPATWHPTHPILKSACLRPEPSYPHLRSDVTVANPPQQLLQAPAYFPTVTAPRISLAADFWTICPEVAGDLARFTCSRAEGGKRTAAGCIRT